MWRKSIVFVTSYYRNFAFELNRNPVVLEVQNIVYDTYQ